MRAHDVVAAIDRERLRLLDAIDSLGNGASTTPLTDEGWTAKDVLAHLIHWATQVAFGLAAAVGPPPYMLEERQRRRDAGLSDAMPTGDESNALAVRHYQSMPLAVVRQRFDNLARLISERVAASSDDRVLSTTEVPFAPGRPLWRFIAGDTFEHWALHAAEVESAAGTKEGTA